MHTDVAAVIMNSVVFLKTGGRGGGGGLEGEERERKGGEEREGGRDRERGRDRDRRRQRDGDG